MEEEAPETAPETISETVPVIVQEDEASAIIEAVEPESAPPLDVEVDNSPVNEPLEIETQDEATTHPEELIKILMSENEILKQENNELRNRIEQLENLHITHPATKANQSPNQQSRKKAGKTSANDATASDSTGAKKPELDLVAATLRTMPCLSADVIRFFESFAKFSFDNDSAKEFRRAQWPALDGNGSGHVSLAEAARWIKTVLYQVAKRDEGERLYRLFYPCFIRAFSDAADAGVDRKIKGMSKGTNEDDYIQKGEFRLFTSYLCIYALMLDTFNVLDGSRGAAASPTAPAPASVFRADKKAKTPPPKSTRGTAAPAPAIATISGDRRLTSEEWNQRYQNLRQTPFVGLNALANSPELVQAAFAEMDADGKGAVLFTEFCRWVKEKEIAQETSFGRLLRVGDLSK